MSNIAVARLVVFPPPVGPIRASIAATVPAWSGTRAGLCPGTLSAMLPSAPGGAIGRPWVGFFGTEEGTVSDEQLDRLPERTAFGGKPEVKRRVAVKTLVSGVVTDLRRLVERLRKRKR